MFNRESSCVRCVHDYSQPQPSLRPILCACRFPVAEVNVPIRYQSETETRIPISVVQIAVASYMQAGSKVPSAILKGFLAPGVLPSWGNVLHHISSDFLPSWTYLRGAAADRCCAAGMLAHDIFHDIQCRTGADERACVQPKAMDQYANAFNLTEPLCNPKIIMGIVKRDFPKSTELMQAGSTVTVGSALFSILYPIKIGFFGYIMILIALFQEGVTPFVPGLAFLPIFALATDIGSLFRVPFERKEQPAQPVPGTKAVAATSETKDKKEKTGNRKKKR